MRTFKACVGLADRRRHLLRMQRRHVVVLLERVGEDLPVAVVVRDEVVTLGEQFERIVIQCGDHRPQELAQALSWLWVEVDEDEPVPNVAADRPQSVPLSVEIEELMRLLHERQGAFEIVAPTVVLAGELPACASDFVIRKVVPYQLVPAMAADVVEGADLLIFTFDDDDRRLGGVDLLGEVTADRAERPPRGRRSATRA